MNKSILNLTSISCIESRGGVLTRCAALCSRVRGKGLKLGVGNYLMAIKFDFSNGLSILASVFVVFSLNDRQPFFFIFKEQGSHGDWKIWKMKMVMEKARKRHGT